MKVRAVICLAGPLLEKHTYDPRAIKGVGDLTSEQNKEVTFEEAEALVKNLAKGGGVNVYWSHRLTSLKSPLGRMSEMYIKDGSLFGVTELEDSVIARAIARGAITNVSLNHSRPADVAEYKAEEASWCQVGARAGTGVVALEQVLCSADAEAAAQEASETQIILTRDTDADGVELMSTPAENTMETEELDVAGFEAFKAAVLKWKNTGERPADAEPGETLAKYQLRQIAGNNFMSSADAEFWMTSWAAQVEESEKHVESLTGALESVMKHNASTNKAAVTPEQRAAAEERVRAMNVDVPPSMQQSLVSVMASMDAEIKEPQEAAPQEATEALRLQLAIEEKKLETAKLHEAASRRELRTAKKKIDKQQEQYTALMESVMKRSRYAPPTEPKSARTEPKAAESRGGLAQDTTNHRQDYSYSLENVVSPWASLMSKDSPWLAALRDKPLPKTMRSALDIGVEQRVDGFGKPLARNARVGGMLGGGLPAIICSEDAQNEARGNDLMRSPLWQCLDKAVMLGGVADPCTYLSMDAFRTHQLTFEGSRSLIAAVNSSRGGLSAFDPDRWAR